MTDLLASSHAHANLEDMMGVGGSHQLSRYIPEGARNAFRFCPFFSCVFTAILFCAATVFLASVVCSISVSMFFGIFESPFYIFPIGCALCLTIAEGAMLMTRGIELTVASFYGTLLPPLQPLRSLGPVAQALLLGIIVLIQFIVFVAYASVEDPLEGLRACFATGWLTCTIIIAIYHVVSFPLGHTTSLDSHKGRNQFSSLSLYLFFDIDEEEEDDEQLLADEYVSANLIGFIPSVLSVLFGTGFMMSRLLLFAVATPPLTVAGAFLTSYVVYQRTERHSTRLMQVMTWMGCIVWLFVSYSMGFDGWSEPFGGVAILVSLLFGVLLLLSLLTTAKSNASSTLRWTLILTAVLVVVCFVLMFAIVHWSLGVFFLVMSLHFVVCVRHPTAISATGSGLTLTTVVILLIACVLVGWSSTPQTYESARSLPTTLTPSLPSAVSEVARFLRSPVCLMNISAGVDITDVALLNEVAFAGTPEPMATDISRWLPHANRSSDDATSLLFHDSLLSIRRVTVSATPFLVFEGSLDTFQHIRSMSVWMDSMALSPLTLVLPIGWANNIIRTVGFASFMLPSQWRRTIAEAEVAISANNYSAFDDVSSPQPSPFVTGTRLTGGLAAIVAVRSRLYSVTFGAPSLTDIVGKFALQLGSVKESHHNIAAVGGAAEGLGGASQAATFVPCVDGDKASSCQSDSFFSISMMQLCGGSGRGHVGQGNG